MPTVPTYQRQTQDRMAPGNTSTLRLPQNNAMMALADVGAHALDVYQQKKNQQDLAQGQEALLALNQYADDLYSHPQTGLLTKQGKNAMGQAQASIDLLQNKAEELYSALPDGPLKEKFFLQFQEVGLNNGRRFRGYEIGQTQHYEQEAYRSGNNMTVEQSRELGLAGDGGHTFAAQLQSRFDAIDTYASVYGKSDDWRQHEKITLQQNAARSAIFHWAKTDPQGFMASNGEPADAGGVTRLAKTPLRGIRNNNPGNIEASQNNAWEGQTGSDGRFVTFATPEHGLRALGKTLLSYQRQHGLDTLNEVVSRYAPSADGNDTDAYIRALCAELGTDGNTPLDMEDPHTLSALCAAIIRHENGGKQPYSDAQINSGISAALGISRLEAGKHAGRNLVYASANEEDQLKARQIASQLLGEQRKAVNDVLTQQVKNIYAATDEGFQPEQIPSPQDFINAQGPEAGKQQWEEIQAQLRYGSVIAAAKNISPGARAAILEQEKPKDPNLPDFAARQQRWYKMQAKFSQLNGEWEKKQGSLRLAAAMQQGIPLDPHDTSNQAAADNYFDQRVLPEFDLSNSESLKQVVEITTKAGIIPSQIKSLLNTGAMTHDPAIAVPMARMYGEIFNRNPAAATDMDKASMAFYIKVNAYDSAGMEPEKAIETAYRQIYQQDEQLKQRLNQQKRDKSYIAARETAAQKNVNSQAPGWFGGPGISKPGISNQLYQRDYQTLYDANFDITGGDAKQSEAITNAMIRRVWAVTNLNGEDEMMKYAPEALYGVNNNEGNWITGQWAVEKAHLRAQAFGGARDDTDLVLVADMLTPRDRSYAVMLRQKNAQGYEDVHEYYGPQGMPVRFKPDQKTSPMYKQMQLLKKMGISETRARKLSHTTTEFDDYRNSRRLHDEAQKKVPVVNIPSNIIAGGK